MKSFKIFSIKKYFSQILIGVLLPLNIGTFQFTRIYFLSNKETQVVSTSPIPSYLFSGWQVIEWTLSIVDYLKHMGDKKQYLYLQNQELQIIQQKPLNEQRENQQFTTSNIKI